MKATRMRSGRQCSAEWPARPVVSAVVVGRFSRCFSCVFRRNRVRAVVAVPSVSGDRRGAESRGVSAIRSRVGDAGGPRTKSQTATPKALRSGFSRLAPASGAEAGRTTNVGNDDTTSGEHRVASTGPQDGDPERTTGTRTVGAEIGDLGRHLQLRDLGAVGKRE